MASEIAQKCLELKLSEKIKTNFQFWKNFSTDEKLKNAKIDVKNAKKMLKNCNFDIICSFDEEFPILPKQLKLSEKPFLLAFRGNVSLLKNSNRAKKAKEYGKKRYVMFNKNTDSGNAMFGLNEDLAISSNVQILTRNNIESEFK